MKYKGLNAWISPAGHFFRVGFSGHIDYAGDWMDENIKYENLQGPFGKCHSWTDWLDQFNKNQREKSDEIGKRWNHIDNPSEYLEYLGWFRLMWWSPTTKSVQPENKIPNKRQMTPILNWCLENNLNKSELPEFLQPAEF